MCGICGIVDFKEQPIDQESIREMMLKMKHRGPDDEGVFIDNSIGLGHVRLSIIDLTSAGHQPFISEDGRYVLVYNGEIYNYIELREILKKSGYRFFSNTDTEVLLKAYIEWENKCLDYLNGMWAFMIYDKKKNLLFGSRDRYGIKPFYYVQTDSQFIFASDIPPILTQKKDACIPNDQIIFDYLLFGRTDHSSDTFFKEIRKLQHGHSIHINLNTKEIQISKWYDLRLRNQDTIQSKDEFLDLFRSSIKLRMRSDVPVGVCLSGGIDSSSIATILNNELNHISINSFSAAYNMNHRANEKKYIDILPLQNKHFVFPDENTFISDLDSLIEAHSEPFSTSAIYAQYKVMELAKDHVTVLLDGQGADEYLAGYHYFFGNHFYELIRNLRLVQFMREIKSSIKNGNYKIGISSLLFLLAPYAVKKKALMSKSKHLAKQFFKEYIDSSLILTEFHKAESLNDACYNHFEYKLEHLLKWEDRNSMFFSLESRIPFLDYRLVEKTISSSPRNKIHKGLTKQILRQSLEGRIPEEILQRKDKVGFATPEEIWLKADRFLSIFKEAYLNKNSIIHKFIQHRELSNHLRFFYKNPKDLWKWINLYLWEKRYFSHL